MSAHLIFEHAPLGAIVAWSDATPRPPERHRRKLDARKTNNSQGRLIRKQGGGDVDTHNPHASFTLHEADYGAGGVIAIRVHRTFSPGSSLRFTIVEHPTVGSVRVFDRPGDHAELVHLAPHRAAAEQWVSEHGYPNAVLEEVTADETAIASRGGQRYEPDSANLTLSSRGCARRIFRPQRRRHAGRPRRPERLCHGVRPGRPTLSRHRGGASPGRCRHGTARTSTVMAAISQTRPLFGRKSLTRPSTIRRRARSAAATFPMARAPWGPSQGGSIYAEGVTAHSTAGHGGFKLSAERNRKVHPMLRAAGGWYEEDQCWAIVAVTFPHLFTALERRYAERTIKDSWPDAWEAIFGTEERRFLVPAGEYDIGRFGFVIHPDRHAVYAGPSSFIGWRGRGSP